VGSLDWLDQVALGGRQAAHRGRYPLPRGMTRMYRGAAKHGTLRQALAVARRNALPKRLARNTKVSSTAGV
jgi:hypothetical protein